MGIGYACCNDFTETELKHYNGKPATSAHKYIKEGLIGNRIKDFNTNLINDFPKYVYDFDFMSTEVKQGTKTVDKNYLYLAAGGDGLLSFDVAEDGSLSNKKTVKEIEGDIKGKRYGYDEFKGCYSVKVYENDYVFANFGKTGLLGYKKSRDRTETLIKNSEQTIFKEVELSPSLNRVYVGTTGYDYPVTEPYYDQDWYQPEFDYNEPDEAFSNHINYYGGNDLVPVGVKIYNLEELKKKLDGSMGRKQPFIASVPVGYDEAAGTGEIKNINRMLSIGTDLYVATGKREEHVEGYNSSLTKEQDAEGKVFKINETEVLARDGTTTTQFQQVTYLERESPCIDLAFGSNSIYILFADYLYKNTEQFINFGTNRELRICEDANVPNCVVFNKEFDVTSVPSGRGPVVDSRSNPTERSVLSAFCEGPDFPYGTPEFMGSFGSGISTIQGKIFISLFNNGYAVFDEQNGSLISTYKALINTNCENFVKPEDDPITYDYNPEYTLACGRSKRFQQKIFILDSLQFTANGSGPGVYNPIEVSNDASRFVGLIKEFEIFSGIIAISQESNEPE